MGRPSSFGLLRVVAWALLAGALFFGVRAGLAAVDAVVYSRAGPCVTDLQTGCKRLVDATYQRLGGYIGRRSSIPVRYEVRAGNQVFLLAKLEGGSVDPYGSGRAEFWNGDLTAFELKDGNVMVSEFSPRSRFLDSAGICSLLLVAAALAFYASYALRPPQYVGRFERDLGG